MESFIMHLIRSNRNWKQTSRSSTIAIKVKILMCMSCRNECYTHANIISRHLPCTILSRRAAGMFFISIGNRKSLDRWPWISCRRILFTHKLHHIGTGTAVFIIWQGEKIQKLWIWNSVHTNKNSVTLRWVANPLRKHSFSNNRFFLVRFIPLWIGVKLRA